MDAVTRERLQVGSRADQGPAWVAFTFLASRGEGQGMMERLGGAPTERGKKGRLPAVFSQK